MTFSGQRQVESCPIGSLRRTRYGWNAIPARREPKVVTALPGLPWGNVSSHKPTLKRVVEFRENVRVLRMAMVEGPVRNPVGVEGVTDSRPRVVSAAPRQPWAKICNAVGVEDGPRWHSARPDGCRRKKHPQISRFSEFDDRKNAAIRSFTYRDAFRTGSPARMRQMRSWISLYGVLGPV